MKSYKIWCLVKALWIQEIPALSPSTGVTHPHSNVDEALGLEIHLKDQILFVLWELYLQYSTPFWLQRTISPDDLLITSVWSQFTMHWHSRISVLFKLWLFCFHQYFMWNLDFITLFRWLKIILAPLAQFRPCDLHHVSICFSVEDIPLHPLTRWPDWTVRPLCLCLNGALFVL